MQTKSPKAATLGYADKTSTKAPGWHSLVVADVLLNNLAVGLFLVASIGELVAPTVFGSASPSAYPLALVLLLADLACLVFDLGDPTRFHHMLRIFKPTSPMSLGTWCLTVFSLILSMVVGVQALQFLGWLSSDLDSVWWLHRLALVAALPFAFGSGVYKGVLFSTSAQPGWKDARWLGAYLVNSALMLVAAEMLTLASFLGEARASAALRPTLALFIVLNAGVLALLVADLCPLLARLYARAKLTAACAGLLVVLVIGPLALLIVGDGAWYVASALISLVLASVAIRFGLIWLPHLAKS